MVISSLPISNSAHCVSSTDTPQPRSKIIAVEGMPGAGKTTILAALAEQFEGSCILLPELNFEPYAPENSLPPEEKRTLFHKLWVERLSFLTNSHHPNIFFLSDRSHFSNLAFTYAFDIAHNTHFYPSYKKLFDESFKAYPIDGILVLDLSPEEGLRRRTARGDKVPSPWSNINFLRAIREFFHKELPKHYSAKIRYIDTQREKKLVKREVLAEILKLGVKKCESRYSPLALNKEQKAQLLAFAKAQNLGEASTRILNVLGKPTLYFLKHSIQLDNGQPVFFNNSQLYKLLRPRDV